MSAGKVPTVRDLLKGEDITLHPSGSETVTGNSEDKYVGHVKSIVFCLDVTAVTGTLPTLDVVIENKDPVSGKYDTCVTFAQKTGVAVEWKYALDTGKEIGTKIRAKWTIGGTSPNFTFSLSAMAKHS